MGEILFYVLIGIANLIIATELAKYGIWEIGIQRPLNKKAILGTFLGVCTVFIGGIISRFADFNPVNYYAIGFVIGIPFLWTAKIGWWRPPFQFIDEQIRGPYRLWIHTHRFFDMDGQPASLTTSGMACPCGPWARFCSP